MIVENKVRLVCFSLGAVCGSLAFSSRVAEDEGKSVLVVAAFASAIAGLVLPYMIRQQRQVKAMGMEVVRAEVEDLHPFLGAEDHSATYLLKGVHTKQVKAKAFGFIPHAVYGKLYLTQRRIAYVANGGQQPALDVSLKHVLRVEGELPMPYPVVVRFIDEMGREKAWHFGVGESSLANLRLENWVELAQQLVKQAKPGG